jgi:hypothetical protein
MWILKRAHAAGIFDAEDVELLRSLVNESMPEGADELEREAHAATIIARYKHGLLPARKDGKGDSMGV